MPEGDDQMDLNPGSFGAPAGTGWNPEMNPVESFTSTIDQAIRQLSLELAAIRAERDGLRLELEGLRAQYELLRMQLHDRDRFQATVRELGDIVRKLNVPVSWTEAPAPSRQGPSIEPTVPLVATPHEAQPAPAPQAPVAYEATPPQATAPVAPPPEPVAPQPATPTFSMPPVQAPTTGWLGEPAAEAPVDPFSWATPSAEQPDETDWSSYLGSLQQPIVEPLVVQPTAPEPVPAPVEPAAPVADAAAPAPTPAPDTVGATAPEPAAPTAWTFGEAATSMPEAPAPAPEPEPTTGTTPEPALRFTLGPSSSAVDIASSSTPTDREPRTQSMALPAIEEGVWQLPEPKSTRKERRPKGALALLIGKRLGSVVAGLLIVAVMLVAIGPKVLPYQTFFVRSGSMLPAIEVGELIFLTKVEASDLEQGDIITFERPDRPGVMVTHRITAIETTDTGAKVFQTKGDANGSPDTWRVPAIGDGWKYAFGVPKLGYVFGYLNTPQARLGMLVIPAVVLGLLSLIDIWKPSSSKHARRNR